MRTKPKEISLVAVFSAVMVIFAQISIPLPFSPVPITLSIFAVFLSTMLLGKKLGVLVQAVYLLLGVCGAPVFQGFRGGPSAVLGPTGGYIVSYILMAYVMGLLLERRRVQSRGGMTLVMGLGLFICYAFGTAWLIASTGMSPGAALAAAVLPFIPLDIVKIAVTAFVAYDLKIRLGTMGFLPEHQK